MSTYYEKTFTLSVISPITAVWTHSSIHPNPYTFSGDYEGAVWTQSSTLVAGQWVTHVVADGLIGPLPETKDVYVTGSVSFSTPPDTGNASIWVALYNEPGDVLAEDHLTSWFPPAPPDNTWNWDLYAFVGFTESFKVHLQAQGGDNGLGVQINASGNIIITYV